MNKENQIAERMFRERYSKRYIRVEEEIIRIYPMIFGGDKISAESYAGRSVKRIWDYIVKRLDEEKNKNIFPTFEIIDPDRMELSWYPFLLDQDLSKVKERKTRLAFRGDILDFIDDNTQVDDRAYEALGCIIAELSGASAWHLTPKGNEFGIDFVAIIPSFGKCHLFPSISKQIRIVGQSKKWNSRVKREKVDDLANKIGLIRTRSIYTEKILPNWFKSAKGLLVGCMLAHSGTQSGGHGIARDHGIIIADSRDIAEIVALSRCWNYAKGVVDVLNFLEDRIQRLLS